MGGFGSGRPGWRRKVDEFRSLDANVLRRAGCLEPGFRGGLRWPRGGGRVAYVDLQASADTVHVDLLTGGADANWVTTSHAVPLVWLTCTKGGSRPLFACPNVRQGRPCGRRTVKLYFDGRRLACRQCLDLAYPSQAESRDQRLLRRANKLRRAMGGEPGMGSRLPDRRKGAWADRYEAKIDKILELEAQAEAEMAARLGFI